jgi:hypothetical protein
VSEGDLASASGREGRPVHGGKVTSWLSRVFELNPAGLNWPRAVYALYCGAIAAAVLILLDLPQPSNYAAEGYRVLWTLCGAGIGVLVMFLAGLLARRTAKAPSQPATQPA